MHLLVRPRFHLAPSLDEWYLEMPAPYVLVGDGEHGAHPSHRRESGETYSSSPVFFVESAERCASPVNGAVLVAGAPFVRCMRLFARLVGPSIC